MTIGIDISQIVHEGTGVGMYVREMVKSLLKIDKKNTYILFGSSLRKNGFLRRFTNQLRENNSNIKVKIFFFPPSILDFFWNRLHIFPIYWFIGKVDIFWSSDWTQPPIGSARGVTTIHDMSVFKTKNVMSKYIQGVHKRKLLRSRNICDIFFCDSEATKKDVIELLDIPEKKLKVVYPGYSL